MFQLYPITSPQEYKLQMRTVAFVASKQKREENKLGIAETLMSMN
jgi:hypothetical protein